MNTNSNTATQLPETYFSPKHMLSWSIEGNRMSVHIEEPWGINGLDLDLILTLDADSLPTEYEDMIEKATATSVNHANCEFEVDHDKAASMIGTILLPTIRADFPNIYLP